MSQFLPNIPLIPKGLLYLWLDHSNLQLEKAHLNQWDIQWSGVPKSPLIQWPYATVTYYTKHQDISHCFVLIVSIFKSISKEQHQNWSVEGTIKHFLVFLAYCGKDNATHQQCTMQQISLHFNKLVLQCNRLLLQLAYHEPSTSCLSVVGNTMSSSLKWHCILLFIYP